jgi:hypothetical protein
VEPHTDQPSTLEHAAVTTVHTEPSTERIPGRAWTVRIVGHGRNSASVTCSTAACRMPARSEDLTALRAFAARHAAAHAKAATVRPNAWCHCGSQHCGAHPDTKTHCAGAVVMILRHDPVMRRVWSVEEVCETCAPLIPNATVLARAERPRRTPDRAQAAQAVQAPPPRAAGRRGRLLLTRRLGRRRCGSGFRAALPAHLPALGPPQVRAGTLKGPAPAMDKDEALKRAVAFLADSQRDDEPPLAVDMELVRESNGLLIVPYNCVQYIATHDLNDQLLDCWPILVDLDSGNVRFGLLEERHLWKTPSQDR